jgi:hypothetical protein
MLPQHTWATVPLFLLCSVPLPTTSALFPWVFNTHKIVYSGWKIRFLPLQDVLVGLYKRRLFTGEPWRILQHTILTFFGWLTSFREHDGGLHEESFWVVRAA